MHSYHIFYFPFKWKVQGRENLLFSEQVDLSKIPVNTYSNWERNPKCINEIEEDQLYNEKNYYYQFIHSVLYDIGTDESIIYHYERKETKVQDVSYIIQIKEKEYKLKLDALNMNLYASGVGVMSFFLQNDHYPDQDDVLKINQFGRRIFPPFMADIKNRKEIADSIRIEGLNGVYFENFETYKNKREPWNPASFIKKLITDLSETLRVEPVIDDRMFVNCWYTNKNLVEPFLCLSDEGQEAIKNSEEAFHKFCFEGSFWYKYLFVDEKSPSCRNKVMRKELLEKQTYLRWQQYGNIYGFTRYSIVLLMGEVNSSNDFLPIHMRSIYARMVELVLIAKASILRFSREVTEVSKLTRTNTNNDVLIRRISSLYKEYILFINQMYFKELTIQDQGIELYELMKETFKLDEYVKDLDNEIEELHSYMMLLEDRERNKKASTLNLIAALFLPATLLAGLFSMSYHDPDVCKPTNSFWDLLIGVLLLAAGISSVIVMGIKKRKK